MTHSERIHSIGLSDRAYNEGVNKVAHALYCLQQILHADPTINLHEAKRALKEAQRLLKG